MSSPAHASPGPYANRTAPELLELARRYDSLNDSDQGELRREFALRGLEPPLIEEDSPEDGSPEADQPSSTRFATVRRFRDLSEAIVARSLLESAGIRVYLRDENLIRLDWQISNFIGGLRLQVEEQDEAAALDLLAQPIPEEFAFGPMPEFEQPHCPVCSSIDISFEGASRTAALTSLFILAVPLPPGPKTWLCHNCGTRWEDTSAPA